MAQYLSQLAVGVVLGHLACDAVVAHGDAYGVGLGDFYGLSYHCG